ncbi:MAG: alpha/beta hydrolase [Clostridiales bacterium]|jgi:pimeloyl-ACP methyl ester carboxylesterase|nr:alpha/beta hydrolase [Clostridiales bacterium]
MVQLAGGVHIFYKRHEGSGTPLLLLHGWGCSHETADCIFSAAAKAGRTVVSLDFPGFGQSDTPPADYTVYDYARSIAEFLIGLGIQEAIVLGHSFGGRVGVILAATTNMVKRLILCDSAGLKPRRPLSYYRKVFVYKIKKRLGLDTAKSGSADYRALAPEMRRVFVSVVNDHLDRLAPEIGCPTLLVWGALDRETPLYMAKKFERLIPDSGLIILQNSGHYAFLEQYGRFVPILLSFIEGV